MKNSISIELPVPLEPVRLHMSMKINVCAWISAGSRARGVTTDETYLRMNLRQHKSDLEMITGIDCQLFCWINSCVLEHWGAQRKDVKDLLLVTIFLDVY